MFVVFESSYVNFSNGNSTDQTVVSLSLHCTFFVIKHTNFRSNWKALNVHSDWRPIVIVLYQCSHRAHCYRLFRLCKKYFGKQPFAPAACHWFSSFWSQFWTWLFPARSQNFHSETRTYWESGTENMVEPALHWRIWKRNYFSRSPI